MFHFLLKLSDAFFPYIFKLSADGLLLPKGFLALHECFVYELSAVESVVEDYFAPCKGLGMPNKGKLVPLVCMLNCDRALLQLGVCIKTTYGDLYNRHPGSFRSNKQGSPEPGPGQGF